MEFVWSLPSSHKASWKNPQDLPFEQIFRNLGTNIFQNVGWSQQGLFDFLPNQVTWIYCHTTKFDHFCSNKSNWKKLYRIQIRSNSHATFEGKGKFQAANHNGHLFWDFVPLTWLPPPPKKKKIPSRSLTASLPLKSCQNHSKPNRKGSSSNLPTTIFSGAKLAVKLGGCIRIHPAARPRT